jgi:hypothetical protein
LADSASQPRIVFRQSLIELAEAHQGGTLRDLYEAAKQREPNLSDEKFVNDILDLASEGTLTLEESIPPQLSFPKFLGAWYTNAWLWLVVGVAALTLAAVYLLPAQYPFIAARWVAGSAFVLFLPGYVTVRVLFPKREFDDIESLALSIGLSLALVPLFGLVLNYTPWGIRVDPIIISLTAYTILTGFAGSWRKYDCLRESNYSSRFSKENE